MVRKYCEEFYKIKLTDVVPSFSKAVFNYLNKNNIFTLGELFEIYDDSIRFNSIIPKKGTSSVRSEFIGTTKLLRYSYLGEDLQFNNQTSIEEFGFSGRAVTCILTNSWKFSKNTSLFERLSNLSSSSRLLQSDGIGVSVREEIISKCNILKHYHDVMKKKEKLKPMVVVEEKDSYDDYVSYLMKKVSLLEEQENLLDTQIQTIKQELLNLKEGKMNEKKL